MKSIKTIKIILFSCMILLFTLSIHAQQQLSKPGTSVPATVKLLSKSDTLQYTLGAFIGQWMEKNGFAVTNQILFKRGMDDVLQNKKLAVTDSSIAPIVTAYQLSSQNARSRQLEEQLFVALRGKPGIGVLPDGVHYLVIKMGTGIRPTVRDSVVINTIGIFPDGTVFEDTFQKKKAITAMTGNLISGLNETIQLMPEGSSWRIFVPSVLAYGSAGLPNIVPPDMALIFDITLMEVKQSQKDKIKELDRNL
jgi:FKBP-type peptidyl-prolyl cis-trans isomerase